MKIYLWALLFILNLKNAHGNFLQLHLSESHQGKTHQEIITLFSHEIVLETTALLDGPSLCSDQGGIYSAKISEKESWDIFNRIKNVVKDSNSAESGQVILLSDKKTKIKKEIAGATLEAVTKIVEGYFSKLRPKAVISLQSFQTGKEELEVVLKYQGEGEVFYFPLGQMKDVSNLFFISDRERKLGLVGPLNDFQMGKNKERTKVIKLKVAPLDKARVISGELYFSTKILKDLGPYILGQKLDHILKVPHLFLCSQILKE